MSTPPAEAVVAAIWGQSPRRYATGRDGFGRCIELVDLPDAVTRGDVVTIAEDGSGRYRVIERAA